jgi:outer membrane protein OmpA-like peptidoglycan-associated protein
MRNHLFIAGALLAVSAMTATAQPVKSTDVYFGFDSSELSAQAKAELDGAADQALSSPDMNVVINGFTDPQGAAPYNVKLSIRRAEAARDYLTAKGVDNDHVIMVYFGEGAARRPTFAQDRRVTIELTSAPLYSVINQSLPIATAVTWQKPATTAEVEGPRVETMAHR